MAEEGLCKECNGTGGFRIGTHCYRCSRCGQEPNPRSREGGEELMTNEERPKAVWELMAGDDPMPRELRYNYNAPFKLMQIADAIDAAVAAEREACAAVQLQELEEVRCDASEFGTGMRRGAFLMAEMIRARGEEEN